MSEQTEPGSPFRQSDGYGEYLSPFVQKYTSDRIEAAEEQLACAQEHLQNALAENDPFFVDHYRDKIAKLKLAVHHLKPTQLEQENE
jgi:hypothetical protein